MGALARYLAETLTRERRASWTFEREGRLFDDRVAERLGFDPRVDVLLVHEDGRRIAVELEVSRADPVANQVKFLLAHEHRAVRDGDVFVSMVSSHVAPGRRAIAAAFTRHMRTQSLAAFQASLLPFVSPLEVKALNACSAAEIQERALPIEDELARVFDIVEPRGRAGQHRIHFAPDVTDVVANIWRFNDDLEGGEIRWARRHVQYFVVDPITGQFAPAKFCAFVPASADGRAPSPPTMTLEVYASLDERDPRFDGHVAHRHLTRRLAFERASLVESPFRDDFERWHVGHRADAIARREPLVILTPPPWYGAR